MKVFCGGSCMADNPIASKGLAFSHSAMQTALPLKSAKYGMYDTIIMIGLDIYHCTLSDLLPSTLFLNAYDLNQQSPITHPLGTPGGSVCAGLSRQCLCTLHTQAGCQCQTDSV